jgi:hypothetical protein
LTAFAISSSVPSLPGRILVESTFKRALTWIRGSQ